MTTERTATDAYVGYRAEALETLAEIQAAIEDMAAPDFEGFVPHWGHVGDINHIAAELAAIRDRLVRGEAS